MKFIKIVKIIAFLTLPNQAVNVYIVAGQSNALGQGTYANTSDSQEYRLASNSSIQVAKAVSNIIPINQAIAGGTTYSYNTYSNNSFSNSGMGSGWDTTYGVEIGLGESLTSQGVEDIYIIKYAVGGAGLAENFSKTATGSPLYSDFINTLSTHISTAETIGGNDFNLAGICLLYTSPSPRDGATSRMPSSA